MKTISVHPTNQAPHRTRAVERSTRLYLGAILLVLLVGLGLRLRAVQLLPIDYDEDDYLAAAQHYAAAFAAGDISAVINYDFNYEHPPLAKLAYGLAILPLPEAPQVRELPPSSPPASSLPQPHFRVARTLAAVFGSLEVLVLALLNPLAGLFLAVNTWQIKYTSQIMLEALPSLTSALAVFFYLRANGRINRWAWLSALFLGLTVASKYTYAIVGVAILVHWLWVRRPDGQGLRPSSLWRWFRPVILWGLAVVAVFFLFDPWLWTQPIDRLLATLLFHGEYAQGEQVQQAGYPAWQPLVWLFSSVPWHPQVFPFGLDLFFAIFAVLGFRRTWQKRRVFALWLVLALFFLLLWPTKWPQYVLILTFPLSLAAAEGFMAVFVEPLRDRIVHRRVAKSTERARLGEGRRALIWLLPGLIVLGLIAMYPMFFQGAMSLTDFSSSAIRDGLNGGVWREAWLGITGRVEPASFELFGRSTGKQVHYIGPQVLLALLTGAASDLLVFSILWTLLSVAAQTGLGVGVAMMLHRSGVRFKGWWRALYILPWAIPEFVGALIWMQVFDPQFGWFNLAAASWSQRADFPGGATFATQWQQNPTAALVVLLITATWYGFPFMMLAATAGLTLIPVEIYDAAAIDGAGPWARFHMITWPLLLPLLAPAVIVRSIFAFNQFYLFYVMQPPYPLGTFAITSFFFFDGGRYGVSAALNLFTVLALVVLIWWFNRWSKASEGVTYA